MIPGDQLRLEIQLIHRRGDLFRIKGEIKVARPARPRRGCCSRWHLRPPEVDPAVAAGAELEPGVNVGPFASSARTCAWAGAPSSTPTW